MATEEETSSNSMGSSSDNCNDGGGSQRVLEEILTKRSKLEQEESHRQYESIMTSSIPRNFAMAAGIETDLNSRKRSTNSSTFSASVAGKSLNTKKFKDKDDNPPDARTLVDTSARKTTDDVPNVAVDDKDDKPRLQANVAMPARAILGRQPQELVAPIALAPSVRIQSAPGAYALEPTGGGMAGTTSSTATAATAHTIATTSSENDGIIQEQEAQDNLVQAWQVDTTMEVEDISDLVLANPVDLEAQEQKQQEIKKQQKTILSILVLVVVVLLLAAGIIGTVAGTRNKPGTTSSARLANGAPISSAHGSTTITTTPSVEPSWAPTAGSLHLLLANLPNGTLENLEVFGTPQWKAWEWLSNHQNITSLPEWRKTQLFALACFYYAFEGDHWYKLIRERWMDDTTNECLWFSSGYGFLSSDKEKYWELPTHLQTPSCNSLGEFTSLHIFSLDLGGFKPFIPPEIALLTELTEVSLAGNEMEMPLADVLPISELPKLSSALTTLNLADNGLTGTIPSELALLTKLEQLIVPLNLLSGGIPSELARMESLTQLSLSHNLLSGSLPTHVGSMSSMDWINLSNNLLDGSLPSELGILANMTRLEMESNSISGRLPTELGIMTNLEYVNLASNSLSGSVSSEIRQMGSLEILHLQQNWLTGSLPAELWSLPALESLWMQDNFLWGVLPSNIGLASNLEGLKLSGNSLSGSLPSEVGILSKLQKMEISDCDLTGPIPSDIGMLSLLEELDLSRNAFDLNIPSEVGLLVGLKKLHLQDNELTGSLPNQLNGSMGLRLDCNQFSGSVPPHLCSALWCGDCSMNVTPISDCTELTDYPLWPGRFPSSRFGDETHVMLNIQTNDWPWQTSWAWQRATNITDVWEILEGSDGGLSHPDFLYSFLLHVVYNTSYRLIVSDLYANGIALGWVTLTTANESVLFSTIGDEPFSEIMVVIKAGVSGSVAVTAEVWK